jgi:hypothetical protein
MMLSCKARTSTVNFIRVLRIVTNSYYVCHAFCMKYYKYVVSTSSRSMKEDEHSKALLCIMTSSLLLAKQEITLLSTWYDVVRVI